MAVSTDDLYQKSVTMGLVEDNFLELGKTLRQLQDRDRRLFAKSVNVSGLGLRKAYYLITIARQFDGLAVPKARLRKIGWTKLQALGPYVTAQNLEELLAMAESLSTMALKTALRGDDPRANSHCVLMYFSPEQYSVFEAALMKAGAQKNGKNGKSISDKETALIKILGPVAKSGPPFKQLSNAK